MSCEDPGKLLAKKTSHPRGEEALGLQEAKKPFDDLGDGPGLVWSGRGEKLQDQLQGKEGEAFHAASLLLLEMRLHWVKTWRGAGWGQDKEHHQSFSLCNLCQRGHETCPISFKIDHSSFHTAVQRRFDLSETSGL